MKLHLATLCLALAAGGTHAAPEPTEADAIAMTERGAALIKKHGKDAMVQKIHAKDPDYVKGALYMELRDLYTGIVLAHPINRSVEGRYLTDVADGHGKHYRRDIITLAQAEGKGWVEDQYKNPASGKTEPKKTYILRVDDVVLEAGIYQKP